MRYDDVFASSLLPGTFPCFPLFPTLFSRPYVQPHYHALLSCLDGGIAGHPPFPCLTWLQIFFFLRLTNGGGVVE